MDETQLAFTIVLAQTLKALAEEAQKCNVTIQRLTIFVEDSEEPFTLEAEGDNTFYLSPGWPE